VQDAVRQVDVIDPQGGDLSEPEPGADRDGDQVADVLVGSGQEGFELRLGQVDVIGRLGADRLSGGCRLGARVDGDQPGLDGVLKNS